MSGGEQQMVAIGRAMMSNPVILMLDEPSLGLSPLLSKELFQNLKAVREAGLGILLVEQNARLSLGIADRGYLLENGSILREDRAEVLRNDPAVQAAYLGGAAGADHSAAAPQSLPAGGREPAAPPPHCRRASSRVRSRPASRPAPRWRGSTSTRFSRAPPRAHAARARGPRSAPCRTTGAAPRPAPTRCATCSGIEEAARPPAGVPASPTRAPCPRCAPRCDRAPGGGRTPRHPRPGRGGAHPARRQGRDLAPPPGQSSQFDRMET
jgi:branched-chain amino acid transport system ATP-binding protein